MVMTCDPLGEQAEGTKPRSLLRKGEILNPFAQSVWTRLAHSSLGKQLLPYDSDCERLGTQSSGLSFTASLDAVTLPHCTRSEAPANWEGG